MNWQSKLKNLEEAKDWDAAIELMQQIIKNKPNDMNAYIAICYLLVNLLAEEDYDISKEEKYIALARHYFEESYLKFSHNAEYLYLMGKIAVMGPWFFGMDQKDYETMLEKAHQLEPNNLTYKESYYWELSNKNPNNPELLAYIKLILSEKSPVKEQFKGKGSVGEYILGLKEGWCEGALWRANNNSEEQ